MAGAKRVPVAGVVWPGLRPRTALGDIGNKVSEQPRGQTASEKGITVSLNQLPSLIYYLPA